MKKLKDAFFIVLFCEEKYQKSARRTHAVLLANHHGVHESVAQSHAWRVRAAKGKEKIGRFITSRNLMLPRVRTYHTRKSSRFVHALSARPHNMVGGELTHARSMCVGVAETGGINTYAKHVCWRRRDMDNAIASHKCKGNPRADSLCTVIFFKCAYLSSPRI